MRNSRRRALILVAASISLSGAHVVEAAWGITTKNTGSTFGAGSIAAPTGLTPTHITSPRSNSLSWTLPAASQRGTGQTVSSSVDGGTYATIATLSGSATTDTDSPVVGDTKYCYKVTTTYSQWTAATAPGCLGPSAPLNAIDAGGAASGNYIADTAYSGGSTSTTTSTINTSLVANPAPQAVYQSERYGNFTYTVTGLTANATYKVRLQEAEIKWSAVGSRTFNVKINTVQVMTNYDIYQVTGAKNKAIALTFSTIADSTGAIAIQFITVKDTAKVSGIEIL